MMRTADMKNPRRTKWWKAALMLAITVLFLYASAQMVIILQHSKSNWIVNRWNVQEKAYEALSLLSIAGVLFLICASCFIVSLRSLILCFIPPKRPGIFARLIVRYGGYPALISFVVFEILFIIQLVLGNIIGNIPEVSEVSEVSEVPATLHYRIISCWNAIPLVLAFETTIMMFVSWIKYRTGKTDK